MKLFAKYSRVNLVATIIIFLFSSAAFFVVIRYILVSQVDDDLGIEQREIETYVKEHNVLPESISVKDQKIDYALVSERVKKRKFKTVAGFDPGDKEKSSYRVLQFGLNAGDKQYDVTVAKSLEGTDDLANSILLITSTTILLILIVSFLINRFLLRRLWKPFYDALGTIKKFKLDKKQSLNFPSTSIEEFSFMNQTLEKATRQAQEDYLLLKEFTENASHEMQTPLAIMRSKLDLLIQGENLSEEQTKTIHSAYQAIEKLARLNQSLLLLTKIENNQFAETSLVNLKQKIEEKINGFNELWQNQNITVSKSLKDSSVKMNPELADILLNNLLSNATRHNFPQGSIRIELSNENLKIINSSHQKELDRQRLFSRFYKQADGKGQNGLGLSIIKQICDASGLSVSYSFEEMQHFFTISWQN